VAIEALIIIQKLAGKTLSVVFLVVTIAVENYKARVDLTDNPLDKIGTIKLVILIGKITPVEMEDQIGVAKIIKKVAVDTLSQSLEEIREEITMIEKIINSKIISTNLNNNIIHLSLKETLALHHN
jgi:hypothetical protein